jgi:hypothetical protein
MAVPALLGRASLRPYRCPLLYHCTVLLHLARQGAIRGAGGLGVCLRRIRGAAEAARNRGWGPGWLGREAVVVPSHRRPLLLRCPASPIPHSPFPLPHLPGEPAHGSWTDRGNEGSQVWTGLNTWAGPAPFHPFPFACQYPARKQQASSRLSSRLVRLRASLLRPGLWVRRASRPQKPQSES